jgi:hypothetical protein
MEYDGTGENFHGACEETMKCRFVPGIRWTRWNHTTASHSPLIELTLNGRDEKRISSLPVKERSVLTADIELICLCLCFGHNGWTTVTVFLLHFLCIYSYQLFLVNKNLYKYSSQAEPRRLEWRPTLSTSERTQPRRSFVPFSVDRSLSGEPLMAVRWKRCKQPASEAEFILRFSHISCSRRWDIRLNRMTINLIAANTLCEHVSIQRFWWNCARMKLLSSRSWHPCIHYRCTESIGTLVIYPRMQLLSTRNPL